jgi:hypothetical protein
VQLSFTQLLKTNSKASVLVIKAPKDLILIKAILRLTTDMKQPLPAHTEIFNTEKFNLYVQAGIIFFDQKEWKS